MNDIVKILIRRDGLNQDDAWKQADEARGEVLKAIGAGLDYDSVSDIVRDMLGLEPDYIENIVYG